MPWRLKTATESRASCSTCACAGSAGQLWRPGSTGTRVKGIWWSDRTWANTSRTPATTTRAPRQDLRGAGHNTCHVTTWQHVDVLVAVHVEGGVTRQLPEQTHLGPQLQLHLEGNTRLAWRKPIFPRRKPCWSVSVKAGRLTGRPSDRLAWRPMGMLCLRGGARGETTFRTPSFSICRLFGGAGVDQQRDVGDASGLEAVHDALVPPGAVAEVIARHHQHHSGLRHHCGSPWGGLHPLEVGCERRQRLLGFRGFL
ncbi:hypothetical protein EYF80_030083 [Liparis tanakae]|uniref:Uncharacterized protein n=1 Tax=Liparis tanakae TaxID=230148 RepID=A0A4Z2H489_9TELE|nr:hypothetical protein EYF80_030083 [Liparis tanakae]